MLGAIFCWRKAQIAGPFELIEPNNAQGFTPMNGCLYLHARHCPVEIDYLQEAGHVCGDAYHVAIFLQVFRIDQISFSDTRREFIPKSVKGGMCFVA